MGREGGDSSASAVLLLTNCCLGDRLLLLLPLHIWGVCKDVRGSPFYCRLFYSAYGSHKKVITLRRKCHRELFRNVSLRHLQNLLTWPLLDLHIGGTSLCVIPLASRLQRQKPGSLRYSGFSLFELYHTFKLSL